jgi:hypothetical protein
MKNIFRPGSTVISFRRYSVPALSKTILCKIQIDFAVLPAVLTSVSVAFDRALRLEHTIPKAYSTILRALEIRALKYPSPEASCLL